MSELFLKVVNMSISAGWLVLAVLVCRLLLRRAPKWVNVLLWGIVAVRLVCPFTVESALSLIPSAETISPDIMMDPAPSVNTGIPALNSAVNPIISQSFTPSPVASANPLQIWIPVFAIVWLAGVAVLLAYTAVSYWRLRRKVDTAVRFRDNIFQSENVASPFVLGVIRSRIYLPFNMDERDMENVAAHELAHIKRRDHWWKPLGFLLLTVHWFNPLIWLAYVLLCRDIELACDEKVIRELGNEQRADYTQALLACSVSRRAIAACPLTFGEVGVKERVKSVLNYRRPTLRMVAAAVAACAVVAVCFLTNPAAASDFDMRGRNVSDLDPQKIVSRVIKAHHLDKGTHFFTNSFSTTLMLTSDFDWVDGDAIPFFYYKKQTTYSSQLRFSPYEGKIYVEDPSEWVEQDKIYLLLHLLQALKYLPQKEIGELSPGADRYMLGMDESGTPDDYDRVITYTENGAEPIDGWYIHLEIVPAYSTTPNNYHGTGDEIIHLFYEKKDPKTVLTLDDVTALSEKGYELTWADFERFDHFAGGNGLYQWVFEIEDPFQLMVGGSLDTAPRHIYLQANDGSNTYIDIRDGGVEEYIALHKDNPLVIPCTAGWQCGYAGYSEELFAKMAELGGVSKRLQVSSIQFLPVVRVDSAEELREITEVLSSYVSLDYSPYPDIPSISDTMRAYDDSFFETSTLFLIYTTAPMAGVRYSDEYVTVSDGTLSIGVQRQWPEAGDYAMEGWLIAVSLPIAQIASAETVEARISSQYYPDEWSWRTLLREES